MAAALQAPVAQLDRVSVFETEGWRFEPVRARQRPLSLCAISNFYSINALVATLVQTGGAKRSMALMTYLLKDRHGTLLLSASHSARLAGIHAAALAGQGELQAISRNEEALRRKDRGFKGVRECTVAFQTALRAKDGLPADAKVVAEEAHPITIADIESDVIAEVLAADDAEREDGDDRRRMQTVEERAAWPDLVSISFDRKGMEEDHAYAYGERLSQLNDEYRQAYARRNTEHHRRGVAALSEEEGLTV